MTKYFISGFETLRCQALRIHPDLDLFMLRANIESTSDMQEPSEAAAVEQEKDDAAS